MTSQATYRHHYITGLNVTLQKRWSALFALTRPVFRERNTFSLEIIICGPINVFDGLFWLNCIKDRKFHLHARICGSNSDNFFLVMRWERVQIALKAGHHRFTCGTPFKWRFVSLAGRWWPNFEYWLGSFVLFHRIRTSTYKIPYIYCHFQVGGGGRTRCPLLWISPCIVENV